LFNSALKKRSTQGKCGLECVFLPHSGFVQPDAQIGQKVPSPFLQKHAKKLPTTFAV
jgi:hypothetical protein